ncbi:MAG: hypothetical protein NWQ54_00480 [Paraglaciecola sp.]|uniref:hypothetical protein n=1 Tax=Paraglaciecola sp. TaxID=1920173 RepID=UPI00273E60A1|nr:hypothetical protein [Paraglaciecola sp.]MDP5029614.1 hypothetical protein [Paraglaciecola sp.]MDP5129325.1 hypothetical protein [Paraglaciecola sp.]
MSTPMTKAAAARIQSATAKANGGVVPKGSFAAKATSTAAKNAASRPAPPNGPSKTGNPSGGGRGNNPPAPVKGK